MVRDGSRYLYGFRSDLLPDVGEHLLRELRYLSTRFGTDEATIEHCLLTQAALSTQLGPTERVMLSRWRKVLLGQQAAAEAIAAELEGLLS